MTQKENIFIIGQKSGYRFICSAISYAYLKIKSEMQIIFLARAGKINEETSLF